jgi:glycosyltransferase involved in cell wall biosynthesis
LLFVGSVEPRKNLLSVLKALDILRERGRIVRLRIVGPGGWKNTAVRRFVEYKRLDGQVSMAGYLDEPSLMQQYLECRALIYPSLLEGFGLPILEALATDAVVLTSRATVMEEIGGKAVLLFDPTDPHDIAETIAKVYEGGFDRNAVLRHGEETLARFSWEESARRHLEAFRQAVR